MRSARRTPRPLDAQRLEEIALRYVGRYATTRSKLRAYLVRKLRERGWDGDRPPDPDALVHRFATSGFVDDRAYAMAKANSLRLRGLGRRRLTGQLRRDGVGEDDSSEAVASAEASAVEAALRFAKRRRLGPFAAVAADDPKTREKAIAAMVRGGHSFDLSKAIVRLSPEGDPDIDELAERLTHTD